MTNSEADAIIEEGSFVIDGIEFLLEEDEPVPFPGLIFVNDRVAKVDREAMRSLIADPRKVASVLDIVVDRFTRLSAGLMRIHRERLSHG